MEIRNFTFHDVRVRVGIDDEKVFPSLKEEAFIPRIQSRFSVTIDVSGVAVKTRVDEVTMLPPMEEGVFIIVSPWVANVVQRLDMVIPTYVTEHEGKQRCAFLSRRQEWNK